jgi:hypothetical protein
MGGLDPDAYVVRVSWRGFCIMLLTLLGWTALSAGSAAARAQASRGLIRRRGPDQRPDSRSHRRCNSYYRLQRAEDNV